MDLEQRVQALEQEVQILKAQIQATLLDIQEQILNNAYPVLRADDQLPGGQPAPPARLTSPAAPATSISDDYGASPAAAPPIRRVSLSDSDPADTTASAKPIVRSQEVDPSTIVKWEEWAMDKVKQVGTRQTRELIQKYAAKNRFSHEIRDMLFEFVALYETEGMPTPARGSLAAASAPATPKAGQQRSPTSTKPAAPPAKPKNKVNGTARPTSAKLHTTTAAPAAPSVSSQPVTAVTEDDPDAPSVVLRLIAGIQNAGAGIRWRKNDG